ncbi:MAG: hypothetical protein GY797_16165 [Deltaproteobacteria bacterium]|nr:hypothetical protein [Deltaproteobacteria bacterium]
MLEFGVGKTTGMKNKQEWEHAQELGISRNILAYSQFLSLSQEDFYEHISLTDSKSHRLPVGGTGGACPGSRCGRGDA